MIRNTPSAQKTDSTDRSPWSRYAQQSRRPIVSLAFVIPILLIYEVGILLLGPEAMRNGADIWLRRFLDTIGFGQYFLLPLLTVFVLIAWHHLTRDPWAFSPKLMGVMFVESSLFGVVLLSIAQVQGRVMETSHFSLSVWVEDPIVWTYKVKQIVGYFGAGVYEELLFRLMLLPCVAGLVRRLGASTFVSLIASVLLTGILFSAAHYQIFTAAGDIFDWFTFSFRFVAGVFFALLFIYRGFGIAVGAHTLYDILVAMT